MTMTKARLDREERRVFCGECNTYLAKVEKFFRSTERSRRRYRCVAFPAGWKRRGEDGVWTLSRHAEKKRDSFHGISFRRADKVLEKLAQGRSALMPRRHYNVPVHDLPAEVICRSCQTRQVLDPEVLRVEPWPSLMRDTDVL